MYNSKDLYDFINGKLVADGPIFVQSRPGEREVFLAKIYYFIYDVINYVTRS